jgi:5-methylcytosine-specific restriction protein A
MARLKMLGTRVPTLQNDRAPAIAATDRIRGYALQKIRDRILRRDQGICRCDDCVRTGKLRPASEVEHYLPLWAGGAEHDANRYAINSECHEAKTTCENRMRACGGFDLSQCTCGRHGERRLAIEGGRGLESLRKP